MGRKKNDKDDFIPNSDTIRERDKQKLQQTFELVFGKDSSSVKKNSEDLKKKIYFYGLIAATLIVLLVFVPKIF